MRRLPTAGSTPTSIKMWTNRSAKIATAKSK